MFVRHSWESLLFLLALCAVAIFFSLGLVEGFARCRRLGGRGMRPWLGDIAMRAAYLSRSVVPAAVLAHARSADLHRIAVEVLVADRVLRERLRRHVRAVLAQCVSAMGTPPVPCAVIVLPAIARDARSMDGCIERLVPAGGPTRLLISLPLRDGSATSALDEIADRLARHYLAAIGVERTVVNVAAVADAGIAAPLPTAPATPTATADDRLSPPGPASRAGHLAYPQHRADAARPTDTIANGATPVSAGSEEA